MCSVATEARRLVHEAAAPIAPGSTIKAQMNAAAAALGYPRGSWRVRAAWNGEAGSWSAAAFEDLRDRHRVWAERQERRKSNDKDRLARLYLQIAQALSASDPHVRREDIAQLVNAARSLGDAPR